MPSLGDASLVHLTAKQLCKGTFWVVWVDVAGIGMPMLDFITSLTEKMQTGRAFKIKDHISVARKQLKTESRLTTYQHCSSSNTIFLRKRSVFFLCLPKFCVIVWNLRLSENYQNFFMTGVPPCQRKFLTLSEKIGLTPLFQTFDCLKYAHGRWNEILQVHYKDSKCRLKKS